MIWGLLAREPDLDSGFVISRGFIFRSLSKPISSGLLSHAGFAWCHRDNACSATAIIGFLRSLLMAGHFYQLAGRKSG